jgi:hypothetical protein
MLPGHYKKCAGMNKDGKCRAKLGTHIGHKKVWGNWYGQVPAKPETKVSPPQKSKRPIKPGWWFR